MCGRGSRQLNEREPYGQASVLDLELDENVLAGCRLQNLFQLPLLQAQENGIKTFSIADRRDVTFGTQLTGRALPGFRSSADFQILLLHSRELLSWVWQRAFSRPGHV